MILFWMKSSSCASFFKCARRVILLNNCSACKVKQSWVLMQISLYFPLLPYLPAAFSTAIKDATRKTKSTFQPETEEDTDASSWVWHFCSAWIGTNAAANCCFSFVLLRNWLAQSNIRFNQVQLSFTKDECFKEKAKKTSTSDEFRKQFSVFSSKSHI